VENGGQFGGRRTFVGSQRPGARIQQASDGPQAEVAAHPENVDELANKEYRMRGLRLIVRRLYQGHQRVFWTGEERDGTRLFEHALQRSMLVKYDEGAVDVAFAVHLRDLKDVPHAAASVLSAKVRAHRFRNPRIVNGILRQAPQSVGSQKSRECLCSQVRVPEILEEPLAGPATVPTRGGHAKNANSDDQDNDPPSVHG
jgi:hypothetical protein